MRDQSLGEKIRAIRLHQGKTQDKLAEEADITGAMVSMMEKGLRRPGADVLVGLCSALGVSADYLLGIDWNILIMTDQIACQARALIEHYYPEGGQDDWPQWLTSLNAIIDRYMGLRNLTGREYPVDWEESADE